MSVRSRGNKCYTRTNKSGGTYTVCDDPPKGSRGQAGVYQAENPTGKQDGRTAINKAKKDKEIALRKVRKSMLTKEYGETIGEVGENNPYTYNLYTKGGRGNWRKPKDIITQGDLEKPTGLTVQRMKDDLFRWGLSNRILGQGKKVVNAEWRQETFRRDNPGEELEIVDKYPQHGQQNYPSEAFMLRDLDKAGKEMRAFDGMPLRYTKIRWLRETNKGKKFLQDNDLERPDAFEMDSGAIAAQAEDLFLPAMKGKKEGKTGYSREAIGEVVGINAGKMTKDNYDKWEAGKFTPNQSEIFLDNALRYKHYLEIARKPIPDWVRDAVG